MLMFVAIVDRAGKPLARAEGEVTVEGDLTLILEDAMHEFRKANPDDFLIRSIEESGYEIRMGRV